MPEEEASSPQHVQAVLIALASSTDNFLVGLSVGLTRKPLPRRVLWGIALCNATGCWMATSGGELLLVGGSSFVNDRTANVVAGLAFTYLAANEYIEQVQYTLRQQQLPKQASLALALPMTINNLAAGVTAGLLGISAFWNFMYALSVSVWTMWIGYRLGKNISSTSSVRRHNRWWMYAPVFIYLFLAVHCLVEAFQ